MPQRKKNLKRIFLFSDTEIQNQSERTECAGLIGRQPIIFRSVSVYILVRPMKTLIQSSAELAELESKYSEF